MILLTARNIKNYWAKVRRCGAGECWPWLGGKNSDGYGALGVAGRQHVATHIALTLDGRPRPKPPFDHALHGDCSDPGCVNPSHLRWGTNQENVDDKMRLRRVCYARGERSGMAKLTEDKVRLIRNSPQTGLALAKALEVSPATISRVRQRKVWAHVS